MKKYDSYKDSGIEWIGKIPEHWEVILFKRIILKIKDGTHGTFQRVADGHPFLSAKNVYDEGVKIGETESYISDNDYLEITKNGFPKKDDLLITCVGTIGRTYVYHFDKPMAFQRSVTFLRFNDGINSQFYKYYVQSSGYQNLLISIAKTSAQSGIYMGDLMNTISLKIPTLEQTQIANYLDHKTTQIDTLISKKQQFITLLQEERIAVINQAVTKGLDPKAKMKDSGIEWLGEIPEHWEVKRLRNLVETIKTGSTPPSEEIQYFEPKEINWYGPGDFDNLILGNSKRKISKLAIDENKCRLFPANSILLIGIGATVGKVGLVLEDCSSNQQLNAIILKDEYNPTFYLYFLSTIKDIIVMEASSATLPIFNQTQTKNIITPVPPTKEQIEISNYIRNQESRIETNISKAQQEIELLKEYKTALISEVVTGKVDVRDVVLN
jgi:type I restriction enzyme S subunit